MSNVSCYFHQGYLFTGTCLFVCIIVLRKNYLTKMFTESGAKVPDGPQKPIMDDVIIISWVLLNLGHS